MGQLNYRNIERNKRKLTNYCLPQFDIDEIKLNTLANSTWVHLGAGNIFRAFLASAQQKLLNEEFTDTGIIVAEGFDYEIIDYLKKFDNLTLNVTLKADNTVNKEIIASIVDYLKMDSQLDDFEKLKQVFAKPSLQLISLTITEKGYSIRGLDGEYSNLVKEDLKNGLDSPISYIGKIVSLLYYRFKNGKLPLAIVSMDNMSHNGKILEDVIKEFTMELLNRHLVDKEFLEYLSNPEQVSYPWTMIDKITPRPSKEVENMLTLDGWQNMAPIITSKNTYVASFVNGEETEYLVIEDHFPNGRPLLEKAGIIFSDRKTVNDVEIMKVTTCLNPLHTALAIFGCLLGYKKIADEMKDPNLNKLVKRLGYCEGLPVVKDPRVISPKAFIDEVVERRLTNEFMPDTPQRIATDTSQKIKIRFGETIKSYIAKGETLANLEAIPIIIAGWFRYLQQIDDNHQIFDISPDPMSQQLLPLFEHNKIEQEDHRDVIFTLLKDENLFGINLVNIGLAEKIWEKYCQMNQGPGSVKQVLKNL